MEIVERLEMLPGWSSYKEYYLQGNPEPLKQKRLDNAPSLCWDLWKNPQTKEHMIAAGFSMAKIKGIWCCVRTVRIASEKTRKRLIQESLALDSDMSLIQPQGLEYMKFQRGGIEYAMNRLYGMNGYTERKAVLIADDMGLGKTIQALGLMNQNPWLREMKVLIVVPASLKLNWRNETRKWIVDGLGSGCFVVKQKWPDALANIVVMNYDVMRKWETQVRETEWDLLVFDEAHLLKNESAQRSVYSLGGIYEKKDSKSGETKSVIVQEIPAKKILFLSGTPMENGRAKEMWPFIKKCDPDGLGRSWISFKKRYVDTDDNYEELQEIMRMKFMIRRMKTQVLKDLPSKRRTLVTLDPDEYGVRKLFEREMSIFREYQQALNTWGLQVEIAKMEESRLYLEIIKKRKMSLGLRLGEIARLRKETAVAKIPGVVERMQAHTENGQPLIVFGHHMKVLDGLHEAAEEMGKRVVRIDGTVSPEKRQLAVEMFQGGMADIFIGGLIPAGVGITLTRASTVLFSEPDWIPGRTTQAEDRAHRIGQKNAVLCEQVAMEGSLDEYMAKALIQKQEKIERAIDGHRIMSIDEMMGLDEEEAEAAKEAEELTGESIREDEDEQKHELFASEKASTKGYSLKQLEKDAPRMTSEMKELARRIARIAELSRLNGIDKSIYGHINSQESLTGKHVAMARRIALKNPDAFMSQGITRMAIEETFKLG